MLPRRLRLMRWILPLLTAATIATGAQGEPVSLEARGFPDIRAFTPRDYQGHNQIWTAEQGPDGVMYFGANAEVITFDGITWRRVPVPGSAFVRAMDIDAAGTVWVAGVGELGRLEPDGDNQLTFVSLKPHLPPDVADLGDFRRIFVMPDGIYFQSDAYLLRWNDEQFDVWPMHETYAVLSERWQDRILVSREQGWQLASKTPGEWESLPANQDIDPFTLLTDLVPAAQGGWWAAASRHGLLHFDGDRITAAEGETAEFLEANRLFGATALEDGRLLFYMLGQGVLITDPKLNPLVHLTPDEGLPTGTIICATPTDNGIVWLGTEQGIVRLDLSPGIGRFSAANGLDPSGAETVHTLEGGPVFATSGGAVALQPGATPWSNPVFAPRFEIDDRLNTFMPLAEGGILAGGLQRMWWVNAAGEVLPLHSPTNISSILIHPRFPNHVFALHLTGIAIWRRDGDDWTRHRSLEAPRGEFQSMAIDARGDLWFGSSNGNAWRIPYGELPAGADIFELPDPTPIAYDESHGLPPSGERIQVKCIDDRLLFTTSYGLFRYDETTNRFSPETYYGERFADGTWSAHYVAPSPLDGVWFEARLALPNIENSFRQIGRASNGEWQPLPLPNLDTVGFLDDLRCEVVDGEEILWICGRAGVLRVNVSQLTARPPASVGATVLHSVTTAGGRRLSLTSAEVPQIPANENSLRFSFGTPGLAGELDVHHHTRLLGFVDGNLETNNSGERTFTNLPPGTYTFEASGRTADHRWSLPAQVTFTVLAPWWLTSVAKLAYLIIIAASVYAIVHWRTRRLEHLRTELENLVAARTAELAQKAEALERLHQLEKDETLAARLAAETARLELLRYQLNPHFLFNSLNSIRALVFSSPDAAGEMVSKLADFCRRTLSRGGDEMVSMADELEMARNYLDIEQVRWQDGLKINFDVPQTTLRCELPQNLLLPLLENAIKYGGRTSPDVLQINIQTRLEAGILTCAVSNTGHWVKPDTNPFTDSTQIGLQNLRQRLRRHYGDSAELAHDTAVAGWVTVSIVLPCQPPATLPH